MPSNILAAARPLRLDAKRCVDLAMLSVLLPFLLPLLVVLPLMLVTGLSMSPGFNAIGGVLLEIMGGRQSARTLHFISAGLIVAFIVVHVGLVIWTGFLNNMRSMITGWFTIQPPGSTAGPKLGRRPPEGGDAS